MISANYRRAGLHFIRIKTRYLQYLQYTIYTTYYTPVSLSREPLRLQAAVSGVGARRQAGLQREAKKKKEAKNSTRCTCDLMWRAVFSIPTPSTTFSSLLRLFIADAGKQFASLGRREEEGVGFFFSSPISCPSAALTSDFLHPAAPLANDDAGPTSYPRIKRKKTSTA